MYLVLLAGGIASGKSTVARELAARGARLVDLDDLSREATATGTPALGQIAQEFGADVLDERGSLRRAELARRAFATPQATARLEGIVHPVVRARLSRWLESQGGESVCVVEVPLLNRVEDLLPMANEVLCVTCPLDVRRARAVRRGMDPADFDARVARQASDDYLVAHATTVLHNECDERAFVQRIDDWWRQREQTVGEFRRATTSE